MPEKRSRRRLVEERRLDEVTAIAESIIALKGITRLSLQEVIDKSSISRGTFFKQFPSKETLITYLGIKGLNFWAGLLDKASAYDGLSREKLLVLHAAHAITWQLKPVNYMSIFAANSEVNRLSVSPELNLILDDRINKLLDFIEGCIQLAIKEENFNLPKNLSTADLAFFIWANRYGATISACNFPTHQDNRELTEKYKIYTDYFLDNMAWKPESNKINYNRVLSSICTKFYSAELLEIKKTPKGYVPLTITERLS